MKIQNLIVILFVMIIIFIQFGSNEIQADTDGDEDDDNDPCWGGDWGNVWCGVGMMVMMSIGILAILVILLYIIRNESFLSPPSNNDVSFQSPSPNYDIASQLDQKYAKGEISQEQYISQSLDNFINKFADEE